MNERTIRDEAGKTWSVMVRRVSKEGAASSERAWALCFRLQGDPTSRTLCHFLPDADAPSVAAFSDEELNTVLTPIATERAEYEARLRAEAESAKAAARESNIAAKAGKAEALRQKRSA